MQKGLGGGGECFYLLVSVFLHTQTQEVSESFPLFHPAGGASILSHERDNINKIWMITFFAIVNINMIEYTYYHWIKSLPMNKLCKPCANKTSYTYLHQGILEGSCRRGKWGMGNRRQNKWLGKSTYFKMAIYRISTK